MINKEKQIELYKKIQEMEFILLANRHVEDRLTVLEDIVMDICLALIDEKVINAYDKKEAKRRQRIVKEMNDRCIKGDRVVN